MPTKKAPKSVAKPAPKVVTLMPENEFGVTDVVAKPSFVFPIPVIEIQWQDTDELNTALELGLYRERAEDGEGIYRSNTAGTWHSKTDLFDRYKDGPFSQLKNMFAHGFTQYARMQGAHPKTKLGWTLYSWGMMYSDRGYATPHNHPGCHFAGVYYVRNAEQEHRVMATGDRVRPGTLEFQPPHQHDVWATWANLAPTARVQPKEGKMVLFPSWLFHMVHPCVGDDVRIAIACNGSVAKADIYKPEKEDK